MKKRKKTFNLLRSERKKAIQSRKKLQFTVKFKKQVRDWQVDGVEDYLALQTASKKQPLFTGPTSTVDPDAILTYMAKDGTIRHYKPTQKQLKAEYYRAQGNSKRKSMQKAGYSLPSMNAGAAFTPRLQEYLGLKMQSKLREHGIDEDKIAEKMAGWLDAQKVTTDKEGNEHSSEDTLAQIKAYEKINEIMKFSETGPAPQAPGTMKKVSIESWTFGDTIPGEEVIGEEVT